MPPLASLTSHLQQDSEADLPDPPRKSLRDYAWMSAKCVGHHITKHVGVGIVCAVAYFDPGNWSVDLQAGSQFGYRPMLFIILVAGLGAMVLQSLAFKLGCVTGFDLATHCRLLLYDRPKHRKLIRYAVLYPLYVLSEIAIISTDLAELLGSAIGLVLIFPALPLWAAVLLTASDVLIFLVIGDPSRGQGRPVKMFEYTVIALVFGVLACFIVLLVKVSPNWPHVFLGYIPSKKLFQTNPDALYTAVGILGATVMPHALFLGSFLATQDRVNSEPQNLPPPAVRNEESTGLKSRMKRYIASLFEVSRSERIKLSRDYRNKYGRENKELSFIRSHLVHGLVDVISSLIALAVPINSAILIIAATVFFESNKNTPAGLFDAYDLIKAHIGKGAAFLFAVALLCAGQTASITATLAGQIVSEGFIEWRISPFLRRIITRMIGLVPSMVVAIAVGKDGIDVLLVASQVALSIVLPFVAFPLIWLTSSKEIMRIPVETDDTDASILPSPDIDEVVTNELPVLGIFEETHSNVQDTSIAGDDKIEIDEKAEEHATVTHLDVIPPSDVESVVEDESIDFSNGWLLTLLVSLIFLIVLAANLYVIVMLGLGRN
ncbi:NRAMP family protein [Abortiporus biennis]